MPKGNPTHREWTAEEEQFLRDHWHDPAYPNAGTIGRHLNRARNSIRQKAIRLGLGNPASRFPNATPAPQPKEPVAKAKRGKHQANIAYMQRDMSGWPPPPPPPYLMQCRWPKGSPGSAGFSWCGKETCRSPVTGLYAPYCFEHGRLAYKGWAADGQFSDPSLDDDAQVEDDIAFTH